MMHWEDAIDKYEKEIAEKDKEIAVLRRALSLALTPESVEYFIKEAQIDLHRD